MVLAHNFIYEFIMADESKKIEDVFDRLRKAQQDQERSAYKLAKAMDDLSGGTLDDLSDTVKKLAKNHKILTEEQLDLIKTSKDLTEALAQEEIAKEKQLEKLKEAQKSYIKELDKAEAFLAKKGASGQKHHDRIIQNAELQYGARVRELKALEESIAAFKEQTDAAIRSSKITAHFTAGITRASESIKDWVAKNATLTTSFTLMKKAVTQQIDELNKATAVGLQSSFATIGYEAIKLKMTFDEFSTLMSKNRDVINQLGTGTAGVKAFSKMIQDTSKDLEFMGKDGINATGRFFTTLKTMGVTAKDSAKFAAAMHKTQVKFTEFSKLYGDNYDQFADLIESQMLSETVQAKLNGLNQIEAAQLRDEILLRTENLKNMGLSNEQIKSFNKSLEEQLDPHKNNQADKVKQGEMTAAYWSELSRSMPENKEFAAAVPALQELARMGGKGFTPEQVAKRESELKTELKLAGDARAELVKRQGALASSGDGRALTVAASVNQFQQYGGSNADRVTKLADSVAQAHVQGLAPDEAAKIKAATEAEKERNGEVDGHTKLIKEARDIQQQFNSVMQSSVTGGLLGFAAGLVSAAMSLTKFDLALRASGGGGLGFGGKGGKGGLGAKLGKGAKGVMKGGAMALGGVALDYAGDALKDSGHDKMGAAADIGASTLGWAGTGAMIGSIIPVIGTGVGAAVGGVLGFGKGLYDNWDSFKSEDLPEQLSSQTQTQTAGTNEISQIVQTGPGWLAVKDSDGNVKKLTGSRNWRNNNPGNIEYGDFARSNGAIGTDGRFAIFPSYEIGRNAKEKLIFEGKNYANLSLDGAISRYAPSFENNTGAYQANVLAAVGGVNKRMADYTPAERASIMNAMQRQEGFKAGTVTALAANTPITAMQSPTTTSSTQTHPTSSSSSSSSSSGNIYEELKKQSTYLSMIAQNTTQSYKTVSDRRNYKESPATVANNLSS